MKQPNLSQSGRSMVEMLGVLAIIGVLSVGGIMGYSYGMDKWRANETIKDINLRRVDLLTQQNGDKNISLDAWKDEKTLYPISLVFDAVSDDPLIQVTRVPERVCEMIVKDMETQAAITVNTYFTLGTENGGCEEMNDLTFYFGDYDVCGTEYCSGNTSVCHPDTQTCVECMDSGDCPDNKPFCNASNVCETCPTETPIWDNTTQKCIGCSSNEDCSDGKVCLPYGMKCDSYKIVDIEGTNWKQIKIGNGFSTSWKNADFLCNHLGMALPAPSDFATGWDGKTLTGPNDDTFTPLTPTSDGLAMSNIASGTYVWTNESRGVGTGAFWEYHIMYTPDRKGFYNAPPSYSYKTVCKPR